jgi:hypothetical protein
MIHPYAASTYKSLTEGPSLKGGLGPYLACPHLLNVFTED